MADHPTTIQQVAAFITLVIEPIDENWADPVSPQTLEDFEINCIDLDLASGHAPESRHGYTLRPVSSSQVQDWLPLGRVRDHDYVRDVFEPNGRSVDSLGEAQVTRLLMECCLLDEPERITGQTLMQSQTFWKKFPNPLSSLTPNYPRNWLIPSIYRWDNVQLPPGVPDAYSCFTSCVLTSQQALRADRLLDGELSAVLKLAVHMASLEGGLRHQIYIVTVISCSYNDVRVVQGVVDFANQSVEIRKSAIVTIYGTIEIMWQKFCIFLGWLLAMPFGDVTP